MKYHQIMKMMVRVMVVMIILIIREGKGECPTASTKWSQWSKAPSSPNQNLGIHSLFSFIYLIHFHFISYFLRILIVI